MPFSPTDGPGSHRCEICVGTRLTYMGFDIAIGAHRSVAVCFIDASKAGELGSLSVRRDRLGGLAVKASASRAEGSGFESRLSRYFSGSSRTSD